MLATMAKERSIPLRLFLDPDRTVVFTVRCAYARHSFEQKTGSRAKSGDSGPLAGSPAQRIADADWNHRQKQAERNQEDQK